MVMNTRSTPAAVPKLLSCLSAHMRYSLMLTSPAPWNTKVFSDNRDPVILSDAIIPAAATAAVPTGREYYVS